MKRLFVSLRVKNIEFKVWDIFWNWVVVEFIVMVESGDCKFDWNFYRWLIKWREVYGIVRLI